ncbi:MAG TPA: cupin domain-containing protein [Luteimonas sp.]|nr:cupin domain-containing protein [Luteimonas sp.]
MNSNRLTPDAALAALANEPAGLPYMTLFRHGSLEIEIYRPIDVDQQTPHTRDEIYVVIAGRGEFVCAGHRRPFVAGDVLFAPAGAVHRFENFSSDFSTWVFFYGPEGGEANREQDTQ